MSNEAACANTEALEFFMKQAQAMLEYFENHNSRRIVGSSVLLIVDNVSRQYDMRIIDIASSEEFDDTSKRDEGYVKGVQSLIKVLAQVHQ